LRDVRLVCELLLATTDWSGDLLAPYAEERRERMRRLRFTAAVIATMNAEFGPDAAARRRRALERSVADQALALFRAAAFVGPEVVPAEAFTDAIRARLLDAA